MCYTESLNDIDTINNMNKEIIKSLEHNALMSTKKKPKIARRRIHTARPSKDNKDPIPEKKVKEKVHKLSHDYTNSFKKSFTAMR